MEDDLAALLSEVSEIEQKVAPVPPVAAPKAPEVKKSKKDAWNPGSGKQQIDRLLQRHHKFINLNPYDVLQLSIDATEEDIKVRYRKLAAAVHPDKNREDTERAKAAFHEIKVAHEQLKNPERREVCKALIEGCMKEVKKERKKKLKAGWAEADLPNFDDELLTATRKAFAEVEQRKKNYIQRLKEERVEEMEENKRAVEQMEKEEAKEKEWAEGREERFSDWHQFSGKRQKVVNRQLNAMTSDVARFGQKIAREGKSYRSTWR